MKVIIWGYHNLNHSHKWIHLGYYKAFKFLGYETHWLDEKDDTSNFNFNDCFFLTEGQVSNKIPINKTSRYVLHNVDGKEHEMIPTANKVNLQFYHKDVANRGYQKLNDYTYVGPDIIHQPWATDLLPHEFYEHDAHNEMNNKQCVWVGSYDRGDRSQFQNNSELDPFFDECRKNNISVKTISPWSNPCSPEENRNLVRNAFFAPAIVGPHQRDDHYIPCRIFKNISYGHMGICNSEFVNGLFDNRLVYDKDPVKLFQKAVEKKNSSTIIEEQKWLISEVRSKHTYIDRANVLLNWFK